MLARGSNFVVPFFCIKLEGRVLSVKCRVEWIGVSPSIVLEPRSEPRLAEQPN